MPKRIAILRSPKDDLYHYTQGAFKMLMNGDFYIQSLKSYGATHSFVVHRFNEFQTELFVIPPEESVPSHIHPNVDSVEVQLSGSLSLTIDGENQMTRHGDTPMEEYYRHLGIRINHNEWHSVKTHSDGLVFLSCQMWLNDIKPHNIGMDWEGEYYNENQGDLT